MQNMAANANSNYQSSSGFNVNRTAMEQHPMHLHGQHFWDLGRGAGMYNKSMADTLNLNNPPFRDTTTLPKGGWSVIQFTVRSVAGYSLSVCLYVRVCGGGGGGGGRGGEGRGLSN